MITFVFELLRIQIESLGKTTLLMIHGDLRKEKPVSKEEYETKPGGLHSEDKQNSYLLGTGELKDLFTIESLYPVLPHLEAENKQRQQRESKFIKEREFIKQVESRPFQFRRFFVFDCPEYYPAGGMNDFRCNFDTKTEAQEYLTAKRKLNEHHDLEVWDMSSGEMVL